jgi:glutathione S-transferase
MILRTTNTSPFGRKTTIAALHLKLDDRIRFVPASVEDPADVLRRDNPLGKMPVLILDDGRAVYDSRVIVETLDHLAGGGKIIPADWDARLSCLTGQALADGIMDAALLVIYEARYRPEPIRHAPWVAYQLGKIERGLAALVAAPPPPDQINAGAIATACALGYLDFRKQLDWRKDFPSLIGWLDAFRAATPLFDATTPTV